MRVFLLKDVERIGKAGEIVKTSEGYARNYLIPRKLALEVTPQNEAQLANRVKTIEHKKELVATKTSDLANKIKSFQLVLKRKMHDGSQLYGSISPHEIIELLAKEGVSVQKNQLLYDTIKSKGTYPITVKLSSKLQPTFTLKVVPE